MPSWMHRARVVKCLGGRLFRACLATTTTSTTNKLHAKQLKELRDFMPTTTYSEPTLPHTPPSMESPTSFSPAQSPLKVSAESSASPTIEDHNPPYLREAMAQRPAKTRKVYIETYGCQMNFNDSEIVLGILQKEDNFERVEGAEEADVVLLMTCAIRENAEAKIWARLDALNGIEKRRRGGMTVGVLGCMAERLKVELMERKRNVDLVCGPDAYRDLPRLLEGALEGMARINVMLSADETYADIAPVRLDPHKNSAFVSIMRGCNNMCAFCIVPFTRGRERSRPVESIEEEIGALAQQGVKEITLLGQNVNSYCDQSQITVAMSDSAITSQSRGFKSIYSRSRGGGRYFTELLERVSLIDPNMRIRFTSPHPKDFPDDLLALIKDRPNICKQIHLPAQSGSTTVLERMRRGYTREAYLDLVEHIRCLLPTISLSTDLIAGFCGETEEEHGETLSLLERVGYDMAYMYAYSMRQKTMAHRRYTDDVCETTKQRRLAEIIEAFYSQLAKRVEKTIGQHELVLVQGDSKRSSEALCGRSDGGRMVVFAKEPILEPLPAATSRVPRAGDYVHVQIVESKGTTPIAKALGFSSIVDFPSSLTKDKVNT